MIYSKNTNAEFNRQLLELIAASSPRNQKRLRKFVKSVANTVPAKAIRGGGPVHISQILPAVVDGIEQRCKEARKL